ncbi:albusnodin/ikarugamycin family macrolactam cyclase [Lentzea sp. NPDC058436]|uniref:albusnodin/ikarugamycin family macrolactam cyclase n=1 Tax=Lentzea sp. NPDC058436 TaxID=3346499 RepID=UPI00364F0BAB
MRVPDPVGGRRVSIDAGSCRVVEGRRSTTVLIGQCLAGDDRVRAADGDPRGLMSLPGAYSAVVVGERHAVLVSDASAQFPLYTSTVANDVVFGSRAAEVAEHVGVLPDVVHLAAQIVCPLVPELLVRGTAFRRVHQLEPGTAVHLDSGGARRLTATPLVANEKRTLDECAEELRGCLLAAVEARASRGRLLSSDFSGGLDSTSLAFLAAQHQDEVFVVTYSQDGASVDDDLRQAELCGRLDSRFRPHVVRGNADHLPYQHWSSEADLPHPSHLAMGPTRLRASAAAAVGSALHLVGEGGDLVLGAPLSYFVDLARRGDLSLLWRHCAAWGRLRHRSPLSLFRMSVRMATTGRRHGLTAFARRLTSPPSGSSLPSWDEQHITSWGTPHCDWLAPPARRALAARLVELADEDDRMDACDRAMLVQLDYAGATQRAVRETGAVQGLDVHAPYLDSEVVRVCLSLPAHLRCDPSSPKPLLRKALAGLVPRAVLSRRTKGDYTATSHQGVRRNLAALRTLLADPVAAEIGLVEPGRVREALERAAHGWETAWAPLNQVLAVELWLRGLIGGVADA